MAKAAYPDLKIELDNATPTLTDISQYVTAINGWAVERILEEITGAGDDTDKWAAIGFLQKGEVELTGPYEDATDSLLDIAKNWTDDAERTLTLTFLAGHSASVECLLSRLQINPSRGAFHTVIVTIRPSGAIT